MLGWLDGQLMGRKNGLQVVGLHGDQDGKMVGWLLGHGLCVLVGWLEAYSYIAKIMGYE